MENIDFRESNMNKNKEFNAISEQILNKKDRPGMLSGIGEGVSIQGCIGVPVGNICVWTLKKQQSL